jgi:hypothetical protein
MKEFADAKQMKGQSINSKEYIKSKKMVAVAELTYKVATFLV